MIIRKSQMSAFEQQMRKSFEDRMVAHLKKFFPDKVRPLEEDALRGSIREGVEKADGYFVTREVDVARFIDLKFALAPDFDELEEMSWAREILDDTSISGQDKIERIYEALPDRLRALQAEAQGEAWK